MYPRSLVIRGGFLALGALLLVSAYQRSRTIPLMSQTAQALLASLSTDQRAKGVFPFADAERTRWFFTPVPRHGLQLREMSAYQKHLAHALLSAGLSQQGYIKATTIMSLEDVLHLIEKDDGEYRNPEKYFFSIFGEPSETGTWGYRVEGHHVSQNFTISNGKVVGAPTFFGANPAEVREGPRAGLRVLAREEDLGRAVFQSLTPAQRDTATVAKVAYKEILTSNDRQAALKGQPSGLSAGQLNAAQKEKLHDLIAEYANNLPENMAQYRMEQMQKAGNQLYFAWAGTGEKGAPHYYRIQAPTFLIEYDDTQNNANHIHTVWRDLTGDFGGDILAEHYQQQPHTP